MRCALLCVLTMLLATAPLTSGCSNEAMPAYRHPECEPPDELVVERTLKQGYRKLYERDLDGAADAFRRVLRMDPAHPEGRAGLREVRALRQSANAKGRVDRVDMP